VAIEGYDLVMLGILAGAALLGYFKGMVWQLAWIAGIVASSYVSFRFGSVVAPFFGTQAPWNRFAAMLAIYVGTSLAVWLVFRVISGAINAVHLSAFDHQLGLLLGLAKGALLCVVVTFFSVILAPAYRHQIVASRSGRLVAELIVRADTYLPKEIHETVDPFVKQFEKQFEPSAGIPAAATGQPPALHVQQAQQAQQPQQSPLKAMWDGVTSAAAWAGTEQGGGTGQGAMQAGGTLPAGSAWFVPRSAVPAQDVAGARYATPAAAPGAPAAGGFTMPQRFAPPAASPMPAPQPFVQQPFAPQQAPPQRYPVGAQTPLPVR
jgi:membrane protein required for colicin V production